LKHFSRTKSIPFGYFINYFLLKGVFIEYDLKIGFKYKSFLELKFFVKLQLLIDHNFVSWASLYPEVDCYIWQYKDIPLKYRIIGFLASHHMCILGKLFFNIGIHIKKCIDVFFLTK